MAAAKCDLRRGLGVLGGGDMTRASGEPACMYVRQAGWSVDAPTQGQGGCWCPASIHVASELYGLSSPQAGLSTLG
jgi:hypothetical protein